MKNIKEMLKTAIVKHGHIIASCAFAFVTLTSNSSSIFAFYEGDEPSEIQKYKKLNK